MARYPFKCPHCERKFTKEKSFIVHSCKQLKRHEESKTIRGQQAWYYYQSWFTESKRFTPSFDTFLTSSYYSAFMEFSKFVEKMQIRKPLMYIQLMIQHKNTRPSLWTLSEAHTLYLTKIDALLTPLQWADITIDTLLSIAEKGNVDVSDVLTLITPNDMIQLLRRRLVSPWLLLKSSKFHTFMYDITSTEEQITLEHMIDVDIWKVRFAKHQPESITIKQIVSELNI